MSASDVLSLTLSSCSFYNCDGTDGCSGICNSACTTDVPIADQLTFTSDCDSFTNASGTTFTKVLSSESLGYQSISNASPGYQSISNESLSYQSISNESPPYQAPNDQTLVCETPPIPTWAWVLIAHRAGLLHHDGGGGSIGHRRLETEQTESE